MSDIKKIKDEFLLKLKENLDLNQVNQIKTDLFGKNGLISSQFKQLGKVAEQERKKFASDLNSVKDELQNLITTKINNIETKVANYKNPYIFLYKNEILDIRSILPLLEKIVPLEIPLFIIAVLFPYN